MEEETSMETSRSYSRPPRSTKDRSHPWLLIYHGNEGQRQTFYNLEEDRYYRKIIEPMRNKWVHVTNISEWLVLEDKDSLECHLWNMISFDTIKIPSFGHTARCRFVLSSHPRGETDCYFVLIGEEKNIVHFCTLSEDAFQQRKIELERDQEYLDHIAQFKGVIYIMTSYGDLYEVNIAATSSLQATRLTWGQHIRKLLLPWITAHITYLIESDDELLLVLQHLSIAPNKTYTFLIFRMDFSQKCWEKVNSIGGKSLFLSIAKHPHSCYPSDPKVKKNSIYYVQLDEDKGQRFVQLFDLEDESTATFRPCPIASGRWSDFSWIMM